MMQSGNFQILSPDITNPFFRGLREGNERGLQRQTMQKNKALMPYWGPQAAAQVEAQQLQNQGTQAQLPYIGPRAAAELQQLQLGNKWFDPRMAAQIALQNAQTGQTGAETARIKFMLANPGFMGGDASKEIAGLMAQGIIPPGALQGGPQGQQPASPMTAFQTTQGAPQGSAPGATQAPPENANYQQSSGSKLGNSLASNMVPSGGILGGPQEAPFTTESTGLNAILNKGYAKPAYDRKMLQSYDWAHTPGDVKEYNVAAAVGAGLDPSQAVREFTSGKTLEDIYKEQGFDPANPPEPDFLPTKGNITRLKQRQAALKEANSLGKFITEGLGPYARTVNGMSPKQVSEALFNKNPDQQAKFLAARMLAPEMANIRIQLAQGNAGQGAVEEMMAKSLQNVGAFQSLVSPEVFTKSQQLADKALTDAFQNAEKAYQVGGNKKSAKNEPPENTGAPKVGYVDGGYKFKGGDPSKPENWSKV